MKFGNELRLLKENAVTFLTTVKEGRNMECKKFRTELREVKFRINMLMSDYLELKEKNIALQKQVYVVKSSQVEFGNLKHEIGRLQKDMDKNAEKNMKEALESLEVSESLPVNVIS